VRATVRQARLPDAVQTALLRASALALSVLVGLSIADQTHRGPRLAVTGLVALAGAAILLSLTPKVMFVGWFVVAPFIQESASVNPLGHDLGLALYFAPTLVFALWTLSRRPAGLSPRFVDVLPAAYFIYTLIWLIAEGEASSVIVKGVYITLGIGIVLYYFFAFGPIGSLSTTTVVGAILAVSLIEGVMGIVDGLTRWNLWHDTTWQASGESRAVATLGNPAILGTLVGIGIVLGVAILVWDGPPRLRKLAVATIVIGLPALYFTLTRAPIIGTAAAVVIVLLSRTRTRVLAFCVFVVATTLVVASWSQITSSNVYRERLSNSSNVQARLLIQDWSWKLAMQRPVFGWGYGAFDRVKNRANFSSGSVPLSFGTTNTSHNTYLTVLVELGVVGFLLSVVPWLAVAWRAVRDGWRDPQATWFVMGAVASLLVAVVAANADDFRFFSFVPAIPWVLLGLLRRKQLLEAAPSAS
jgi:O-antigen ligase